MRDLAYSVTYSQDALDTLLDLPKEILERVRTKIEIASQEPQHFFERLKDRPDYRLRIGDWRVIAMILPERRTMHILMIGHRKNIYER